MKFKEHSSSAVKVGDIKSNAVSIDAANLDFIITILSSGLYSNPISSFIREIVSNAWDSHVEAGNTTQPVVLELGQNSEGQHFCKIQDFGVGLSPERFNKVYRNIGSSTKRGTNDQIGGFGIGRFSALSYSNVVRITSYHDGTEYLYLMNKENNKLSIDLLFSKPTTHANGVAVEIDIKKYDVDNFVLAIENQLAYFNNLVVIESIPNKPYLLEKRFNNFIIKDYKNFCCNTLNSVKPTILLGKVNYPIRFNDLKKKYLSNVINSYPIALKFNIGDIGVTPNREELLYTTESIKAIEDKLDASIAEIEGLFNAQNNKDHQDINKFFDNLLKVNTLVLAEDDTFCVNIRMIASSIRKFKGKQYSISKLSTAFTKIKAWRTKESYYTLSGNKTLNSNRGDHVHLFDLINKNNVYISDISKLKTHAKAYIRETYVEDSTFIKEVNKRELSKVLIAHAKDKIATYDYDFNCVKLVLHYLENKYDTYSTFDNSSVPNKFIEDRKARARANRSVTKKAENYWKQNVSLSVEKDFGANESNNYLLKDLNTEFKKLTVYSFKGDPRLENLNHSFRNVKFVGVAPTKIKLLKDLSNFVNVNDFMDKKYKAIRNLATVMYLDEKIPNLQALSRSLLLSSVSTKLYKELNILALFCRDNAKTHVSAINDEVYDYCLENNAFNEEILGVYKANEKEFKGLEVFTLIETLNIGGYSKESEKRKLTNLITDYVLSKRLFRPDLEAVKKLKKETILNK